MKGQQVRDLSLQYTSSDCSETLPRAAPVVQTVAGWEEALPNSSPNATTRNSTAEEEQRLSPACKLTRGKAIAARHRATCNTVSQVQALPTGLDSQLRVSAHWCIPVTLLGLEEVAASSVPFKPFFEGTGLNGTRSKSLLPVAVYQSDTIDSLSLSLSKHSEDELTFAMLA